MAGHSTLADTIMRKAELVKLVAQRCQLTPYQADDAVSAFFEHITNALARGESTALTGFGRFQVTRREARSGKNPQTGEAITIPAKNQVHFRPGERLRRALNPQGN